MLLDNVKDHTQLKQTFTSIALITETIIAI